MFVRKLETTIVRTVTGGGLVINTDTGVSLTVNSTGLLFLRKISNRAQEVGVIVQELCNYFEDIEIHELEKDFIDFIKLMADNQVVAIYEKQEDGDKYTLRTLHVDITRECNERCVHCYIPNSIKNKADSMSFGLFCRIVDEFVELGGEEIIISGGEPLIYPSVDLMINYCDKKGLDIALLSNLISLNTELLDLFKSTNVKFIQTSVYSLRHSIHDGITKRKGSLQKTLSAIELLLKEGVEVHISCPIMQQNMKDIESVIEFAKIKHIRLRAASLLLPKTDGDDSFLKNYSLRLEQQKRVICRMMDVDKKYAEENLLEINQNSCDLCDNPIYFLKSSLCTAGINSCAISPTGDVYPCPEWESFNLGNVNKQSLSNIWYDSPSLHVFRQINCQENFKKCLECDALDYCKRCLKFNEIPNKGELLRINKQNCDYAWMVKSLVEEYIPNDNNR